ncbi:MAG: LysM peptidoglycan-binding protein [Segetibacter sp.]|nr:LysM peptidoglycan-binding protein [Segetibacter sp.]
MIKLPKLIALLAVILLLSPAFGQSENNRVITYIKQYKDLAIAEMLRTGIPASITLAQGILETGGGQSDLASNANNHFGIKCKSEWTGERVFHDDDTKGECFRKYESAHQSYYDHSEFLRTRPNYAFLFKLDPTDFEGWAKGLKKAGYATNPAYPQRLIKLIVENNLQEYTLHGLAKMETKEKDLFELAVKKNEVMKPEEVLAVTPEPFIKAVDKRSAMQAEKNNDYKYNQIFLINETKVLYVLAGTSILAIANNHNISYKKILEFNDLISADILAKDQLIFLQKKPKKGNKDIHIVEKNEDLQEISQKEGVQLASILEMNRLEKGMTPAPGEKLYLKAFAPVAPRLALASPISAIKEG